MSEEQKPIAWMTIERPNEFNGYEQKTRFSIDKPINQPFSLIYPLYNTLPKQYKPLSDDEILKIIDGGEALNEFTLINFAREIEKAHNIGIDNG